MSFKRVRGELNEYEKAKCISCAGTVLRPTLLNFVLAAVLFFTSSVFLFLADVKISNYKGQNSMQLYVGLCWIVFVLRITTLKYIAVKR